MNASGLTSRSLAHHLRGGRPDIDREAVRYFVYTLTDEHDRPVYVGRSCDVPARIKAHAGRPWLDEVRSVSLTGPFTWDEAVRVERDTIEREQPRGNVALTTRDHRPATAARSARRSA